MSDSYIDRIKREGPLPATDDDTELVGDDDESPAVADDAEKRHRRGFIAMPTPGIGAYPVPLTVKHVVSDGDDNYESDEEERTPQEPER